MEMNKLDILAFGAHPDDIELGCGGTLIAHAQMGKKIGLIDLTLGELGTRGTPEIRLQEAQDAARIMGAAARENLRMADGYFKNDEEHQRRVIQIIRKYKPEVVLCNAPSDRHPDHGRGSALVVEAAFLSGLRKIETQENGTTQEAWRPKAVYRYVQFYDLQPSFLVDISPVMDEKIAAYQAHKSQFYDPQSQEPATLISQPGFLENIKGRARYFGQYIHAEYAEGFIADNYLGVNSLFDLKTVF
ncbi:MAG: bacillithiol biosynthesis deacetylase BshB1 [Flavobacteriales bacterium]|nr:bacillithiol biosynthesis deacetylase BshB1 [Flavobacteriales bacterium]